MTFDEILAQILTLLQREKRVSYRALKRRFELDDTYLEDVKDELIYAKKLAVDEENRVLVWVGEQEAAPAPPPVPETPALASAPATDQARVPLAYTPKHLAEKILTSRSALEGERKQVTVLFADLKGSTELICGLRSPHRPLSATQNNWHNPKLLCSQWVRCFHLGQESLGWPTP
jgi:hypothetical protein